MIAYINQQQLDFLAGSIADYLFILAPLTNDF